MHPTTVVTLILGLGLSHCQSAGVFGPCNQTQLSDEPALAGVWQRSDSAYWRLEHTDIGRYQADHVEFGDTVRYTLDVCRAGGMVIGDLYRRDGGDELLPLHQYGLIDQVGTSLSYRVFDDDWIREHLQRHPRELEHLTLAPGEVLVIARPAAMRRFLIQPEHAAGFLKLDEPYSWRGPVDGATLSTRP